MKKLILNYIEYSKEIETSQPIIRPQFVFNEKIEKINNDSLVSFIATFFPDEKFLIEEPLANLNPKSAKNQHRFQNLS